MFNTHIEKVIKRISGIFIIIANFNFATNKFEGFVIIDDVEYKVSGKSEKSFVSGCHAKVKKVLSN